MTVVQFLLWWSVYPETKGQTLEQLQRKLMRAVGSDVGHNEKRAETRA